MAASEEYIDYILGQLSDMGTVTHRRMFGGAGLYLSGLFFGLIDDDILYFKVDDTNRAAYTDAGMEPFRPYGPGSYSMSYFQVPEAVIEDPERLAAWGMNAVEAARRAKQKPRRR
jgi:DNA transformation protein